MGSAGAESSQPIGPAGFVSGVSPTVATNAKTSMSSAGALPWRQVTRGTNQSFSSAGVVPVDRSAECLRADLSIPGSVGSFMARVFLDSGSAITSISMGLLQQLSSQFGYAQRL
ncbi:unnamed protein product [Sphacelaria rigidula]